MPSSRNLSRGGGRHGEENDDESNTSRPVPIPPSVASQMNLSVGNNSAGSNDGGGAAVDSPSLRGTRGPDEDDVVVPQRPSKVQCTTKQNPTTATESEMGTLRSRGPTQVEGLGRGTYNKKSSEITKDPRPNRAPTVTSASVGIAREKAETSKVSKRLNTKSNGATKLHNNPYSRKPNDKQSHQEDLANSVVNEDLLDCVVNEKTSKSPAQLRDDRMNVVLEHFPGAVSVPGSSDADTAWRSESFRNHSGANRPQNDIIYQAPASNNRRQRHSSSNPPVLLATRVSDTVVQATAVPDSSREKARNHKYKIVGVLILVVLVGVGVALGVVLSSSSDTSGSSDDDAMEDVALPPTLAKVKENGVLRCGVSNKVGFSLNNDEMDERDGFEVDLCAAVAAALFGPTYSVETVVIPSADRFPLLTNGTLDLVAHSSSFTMERDIFEVPAGAGLSFSVPYLYDGLGFGGVPPFGSCANNLDTLGECENLRVCVEAGTTHIAVLAKLLPSINTVVRDTDPLIFQGLIDGDCNAIAGEQFNVAEVTVRSEGYTGPYEVGDNLFSKEPLALVTRDGDPEWADFVNWVLRALLTADARNISMLNANEIGTIDLFGEEHENMLINAIAAVGNYGDMYERSLERIVPRHGQNLIYDFVNNSDTGLLYPHPLGVVLRSPAGPGPVPGGTLEGIAQRGFLRCGVSNRTGFSQVDPATGERNGMDVDYCRALSASLFGGAIDTIEFVDTFEAEERFLSLANGDVDVLGGVSETLGVKTESSASGGIGFAFTQPYFYAPLDLDEGLMLGDTLALVTNQNDTQWEDFVYWIVASTVYAEEINATQKSSNDMPEVNLFGAQYARMFRDAILVVGNYAEIYARNVESFIPRSGPNVLNVVPRFGPQHFAFPIGM